MCDWFLNPSADAAVKWRENRCVAKGRYILRLEKSCECSGAFTVELNEVVRLRYEPGKCSPG